MVGLCGVGGILSMRLSVSLKTWSFSFFSLGGFMAKAPSEIRLALKPAHLHAIGLVAAQWSSLEINVLFAISIIGKIHLAKVFAIAPFSDLPSWLMMLRRLIDHAEDKWKEPLLIDISNKIEKLRKKRNSVVHAAWSFPGEKLSNLLDPQMPREVASGTGIPKRGLKSVIAVEMTPKQIRAIAKEIEEVQQELREWMAVIPTKRQRLLFAQALRDHQSPLTMPDMPQTQHLPSLGLFGLLSDQTKT